MIEANAAPDGPPCRARFWGVRGSAPVTMPEFARHGGNTSCLHVEISPSRHLIFDAGTGVRLLGNHLMHATPAAAFDVDFFLTHFHLDHLQGLPFFSPIYSPASRIRFHGQRPVGGSLRETLERLVAPPYFPAALAEAPSEKSYIEVDGGSTLTADGFTVRAVPLNHPQGAMGWRLERRGRTFLYATDHEHGDPASDAVLLEAARGVGTLIVDAHFAPEEYETYRGWGHSNWREAARLASKAGAGRLILFHHAPFHTDSMLDEIIERARAIFPATDAAREGMEFDV